MLQRLGVLIPVHGDASVVGDLVEEVFLIFHGGAFDVTVVLIDDGSPQTTWVRLKDIASHHPGVVCLRLAGNSGQHAALREGIAHFDFDIYLTLDDDGQNPPNQIPKLLDKVLQGYDLVFGAPDERHYGPVRQVGSWLLWKVTRSALRNPAVRPSSFKAFDRALAIRLQDMRFEPPRLNFELLELATNAASIPVAHKPSRLTSSRYTLSRLLRTALTASGGATRVSGAKFATLAFVLGSLSVLAAFGLLLRLMLFGVGVPGWASLALALSISNSITWFLLGVVLQILARHTFLLEERKHSHIQEIYRAIEQND